MFDGIILDQEQIDLLRLLVEATRNVGRENRRQFHVARTNVGAILMHPGIGPGDQLTYLGDVEILAGAGLLNLSYGSGGSPNFDVSPLGFRYYEHLHQQDAEPVGTAERMAVQYLDSPGFHARYSVALGKWREAERLLWSAESTKQLTAIGHHCREAMQAFATALVQEAQPPGVDQDPAHVVARLKAVLHHRRNNLGDATSNFLAALLAYWGTVSDLIQRQEHGAQKEGKPLIWIDARRIIFQTIVVMFEIDTTLAIRD